MAHAETLTLKEIAQDQLNTNFNTLINILREHNIEASQSDILEDIAKQYDYTPAELYSIISNEISKNLIATANKGYGHQPLNAVCIDLSIFVIDAYTFLFESCLQLYSDTEVLSDIADKNNLKSPHLVKILIKEFDVIID